MPSSARLARILSEKAAQSAKLTPGPETLSCARIRIRSAGHGEFFHRHDLRLVAAAINHMPQVGGRPGFQHVVRHDHCAWSEQPGGLQHPEIRAEAASALVQEDGVEARFGEAPCSRVGLGRQPRKHVLGVARAHLHEVRDPGECDHAPRNGHPRGLRLDRDYLAARPRDDEADCGETAISSDLQDPVGEPLLARQGHRLAQGVSEHGGLLVPGNLQPLARGHQDVASEFLDGRTDRPRVARLRVCQDVGQQPQLFVVRILAMWWLHLKRCQLTPAPTSTPQDLGRRVGQSFGFQPLQHSASFVQAAGIHQPQHLCGGRHR
mmetsp:Transcript_175961/g.564233  ORF Transcript_175961/g.564233 Transcript_175961/m.564233 type:complete len:321 (-) Transcript_175961:1592-2554(-)